MVDHIEKLHPAIRDKARKHIEYAKTNGIDLRVVQGLRTFEEQTAIFNQPHDGKDNDGDGLIDEPDEKVSNAKAGQSFHNYGLAYDVVPFVDGKPQWGSKTTEEITRWKIIGKLGEQAGMDWGFRLWGWDFPHFQFPKGWKFQALLKLKQEGHVDQEGYVLL